MAELLGQQFELEFEEGELRLTAGVRRRDVAPLHELRRGGQGPVDALDQRRAEEYRRAYVDHHERHRANGRISLPRRYLVTLGRRRGGSG